MLPVKQGTVLMDSTSFYRRTKQHWSGIVPYLCATIDLYIVGYLCSVGESRSSSINRSLSLTRAHSIAAEPLVHVRITHTHTHTHAHYRATRVVGMYWQFHLNTQQQISRKKLVSQNVEILTEKNQCKIIQNYKLD